MSQLYHEIPYERMGSAAVRMLMENITHPNKPVSSVEIPCEWHEGDTVASPRTMIQGRLRVKKFVE